MSLDMKDIEELKKLGNVEYSERIEISADKLSELNYSERIEISTDKLTEEDVIKIVKLFLKMAEEDVKNMQNISEQDSQ